MTPKRKPGEPCSRTILVPTDFSGVCDAAIRYGFELARSLGYSLVLLHVTAAGKEEQQGRGSLQPSLEMFRNFYRLEGPVRTRFVVRRGNIFSEIRRAAEAIRPNLMILGTHGRKGMQQLYGSYALRVVLDAPCPVIVLQNPSFVPMIRKVLVPVHGEMDGAQVSVWLNLFHALFGSHVTLLRMTVQDEDLNKSLKEIQSAIGREMAVHGIPFDVSSSAGEEDFSTQVLQYAGLYGVDLIMTIPGSGDHRFSFSAWNERLMFNPLTVPVMCLNPLDDTGAWCRWMEGIG